MSTEGQRILDQIRARQNPIATKPGPHNGMTLEQLKAAFEHPQGWNGQNYDRAMEVLEKKE